MREGGRQGETDWVDSAGISVETLEKRKGGPLALP